MEAEEKVPEVAPVVSQTEGEPTNAEIEEDAAPEGEGESDEDDE